MVPAARPQPRAPLLRDLGPRLTVCTATGQQTYRITPSMRVLGRGRRPLGPAALRVGDILLRQGETVQDESADAVTLIGQVAQVEATRRLLLRASCNWLRRGSAQG